MINIFLFQAVTNNTNNNWLLDKLLPSLIGSGTALLVFYLTTRRDRNKEQKKKSEERIDKVNFLKSLIDNIINVTSIQRNHLNDHIAKIRQNAVDFHLMIFVPLTDFKRAVDTLSKEEYHSAFNKFYKEKIDTSKIYNRIISNVDYLQAQFEEVPNMLKKSQQFDHERKLQYKQLVDRTVNMTGRTLYENRENMLPVFQQIDTILLSFMEGLKDNSDLTYHNDEFVCKMDDFLVNYMLTSGTQVPNVLLAIEQDARNARGIYNTIIKSNLLIADELEAIKQQIENSLNELIKHRQSLS